MKMTATTVASEKFCGKPRWCFLWTRIFLSVSLALILGVFSVVYTIQQDSLARAYREQDQQETDKLRKQTIYDSYINDISKNLLLGFNTNEEKTKLHIRVKTLNALRHLDPSQKKEIILFLYENHLIRSDQPELAINLTEADLTNVHFVRLCNLNYLYLPGVLADKIVFDRCKLKGAIFNGASMTEAKFIDSYAAGSEFFETNLTNAVFIQTNNLRINFSSAILIRSSFAGGPSPQKVNFANADLFESDLTEEQLSFRHFLEVNTFINTRFPNGSFSDIDSSQLIMDGGAELSVSAFCDNLWDFY
jgi:uncharacterized protein YjbI with pentapeptide repeats